MKFKTPSILLLAVVAAFQGCFDNESVHGGDEGDGNGGSGNAGGAVGGSRSGSAGSAGKGTGGSSTSGAAGSDGGAGTDTGGSGGAAGGGNGDAGIVVEPSSGLVTSEEGEQATFAVRLSSRPTGDVSIRLSSDDASEGTVAPTALTFTRQNWSAPQSVTVTGVDDDSADGAVTYSVVTAPATSSDAEYDGLDADDVELENTDDETPGFTVDAEPKLETRESGAQATFTVRLNSEPSADVTLGLESSDSTEGSLAPAELVFTADNWRAPQLVTVTGVDDSLEDGPQMYQVTGDATSSDTGYSGESMPDVVITNIDDDTAGVTIGTVSGDTTEQGGEATFTVELNTEPTADVTINLTSSDTGEGTVSPPGLVFTADNWDSRRTVTVTGVDDDAADGRQPYFIVTSAPESSDADYAALNVPDVQVYNIDDDHPGITVSEASGDTSEEGEQATFTVRLNSQPADDVTIAISSDDTGEGTVSPASLRFTQDNWNAPQTVTATGVNDDVADGNQPYSVITGATVSSDPLYDDIPVPNVHFYNIDDDSPGVIVGQPSGSTTEWGGQATFTIRLQSEPSASVSIALSSSDTGEGRVSPASVTFTPGDWDDVQTVTVTGQDDLIEDLLQTYSIITGAAMSSDPGYSDRPVPDVEMTNVDDDVAGFTLTPVTGPTSEWGGQATFTIRLNTQPTADVTIGLTSSATGEGSVSPSSLVFTDTDWDDPQTVTVTGEDDALSDGAQPYTIVTANAVSSDAGYSNLSVPNVSMTNLDDEEALDAMAALDGRAMLTPCGANHPMTGIRGCWHYPGATMTCPGGGNVVVDSFTVAGSSSVTYDVTIRVRGIVELKHFLGGTRQVPTGTLNAWYVGGTPDASHEPAFNVYQMTVSSPAQTYHLNSAPSQAEERRESFQLDYQVTIPVHGGATITLTNRDPNCIANKNCGAPATPDSQCVPITLSSFTHPQVGTQPYNGQFVVFDVVQARPQ